jgi:putative ABC transport system permease protein
MPVNLPDVCYPKVEQRVGFFKTLLEEIRSLPGVEAASAVTCLPLGGGCWNSIYLVEGRPIPSREQLSDADFNTAQPGYFGTLGIPFVKGRDFGDRDAIDATPVLIVNESFARQNWPAEDPLGKRIKQDWTQGTGPWMTVIGVSATPSDVARPASYRHGEPPRSMQWSCSGMSEAHPSTRQTVGKISCAGSVLEGFSPRRP